MKKSILLHACCAPCFCYVAHVLKDDFDVTTFFYNPNIAPYSEYEKRLKELREYTHEQQIPLITGEYNQYKWNEETFEYRDMGERSERCWACYKHRLEATFKKAQTLNFQHVATVLSISPHKDAKKINEIGQQLEDKYNICFLEADFKKQDGFRKSVQMSENYGFYRQNYCGCVYSKNEREILIKEHR